MNTVILEIIKNILGTNFNIILFLDFVYSIINIYIYIYIYDITLEKKKEKLSLRRFLT
jgi:hypothetical protein